jgi:hypothetical protein
VIVRRGAKLKCSEHLEEAIQRERFTEMLRSLESDHFSVLV